MNNSRLTPPVPLAVPDPEPPRRLRLRVQGAVQGVGFRPYVFRLAGETGLAGWVSNDPQGVSIEVEGPSGAVEEFRRRLPVDGPPLAVIHSVSEEWVEGTGGPEAAGFRIRRSATEGAKTAVVLPDAVTCPACRAEVLDPEDRRHGYPFTNCTHCGPRFTIVRALPYDRPNTTMERFRMCPRCRREYEEPLDRRFHAQPNACPECGPRLALWDGAGEPLAVATAEPGGSAAVVREAASALRAGRIVALKGLGGFQLLVAAGDAGAVDTLRRRKRREAKPFALMVRDLEVARALCHVPPEAAELLSSVHGPIVLLRRRPGTEGAVAPAVAPGNPWLGVMLPTTPLHHLLLRELDAPVVATSGNLSDEPIATDERDAVERLGAIADRFLVHDRPIARHADDSVARVVRGAPRLLRRARGYAPMPVFLPERPGARRPTVLAVGSHLKNTVALALDGRVYVSQHLGDMETPRTLDAFERVIADFLDLYDAAPEAIAHDLHPDYASTRAARRLADEWRAEGREVRLVPVQHHHAHLAACLAENGVDAPALGVTWDGTGYGTDGTVWGGEMLVGDAAAFRRVARLRPFRLAGGEAAVREPRRVALALLADLLGPEAFDRDDLGAVASFELSERRLLGRLLERGVNAPVTTSAGRLFDGVAALAGLAGPAGRVSFEGQAAMALEFATDGWLGAAGERPDPYPLPLLEAGDGVWELDWRPLVAVVLEDLERGAPREVAGRIGARFHGALAEAIVAVARRVGRPVVALSGGCFQNRLLTEWASDALEEEGFEVLLHRMVPPNDGGIAYGQAAVASALLAETGSDTGDETGAGVAP